VPVSPITVSQGVRAYEQAPPFGRHTPRRPRRCRGAGSVRLVELRAPTPLAGVEPGFVTRADFPERRAPTPLAGVEPGFVARSEAPARCWQRTRLHPGERGGGPRRPSSSRSGDEPRLHPGERGGGQLSLPPWFFLTALASDRGGAVGVIRGRTRLQSSGRPAGAIANPALPSPQIPANARSSTAPAASRGPPGPPGSPAAS
jgi:hypothetical protein